jgi:hypothetical protein
VLQYEKVALPKTKREGAYKPIFIYSSFQIESFRSISVK